MARRELAHPTLRSAPGFSRALEAPAGRTVWFSGQVPTDDEGRTVGEGDMAAQADVCLAKIAGFLEAEGSSMDAVVKVTSFTTSIADVGAVREVRERYFNGPVYPAMTTVEVRALADPAWLIEIEAVAVIGGEALT